MKKLLFTGMLLLLVLASEGQVQTEAKVTGKHAETLSEAKQRKAQIKRQKQEVKQLKQQIKQQKKARKLYLTKYDSIRSYHMDSIKFSRRGLPDSLKWASLDLPDSLEIAEQVLTNTGFPEEYKSLVLSPTIRRDSLQVSAVRFDSLVLTKGEKLSEQIAREYLPDELAGEGNALDAYTKQTSEISLTSLKSFSKPNPNLIKPDQAKNLFSKVDPETFQEAQEGIQKLKKKYNVLPDTRYPEQGTKRNSLEELPFAKRVEVSGNVSLQSTDPLIFDSRLQCGYWINRKWLAGAGVTLREQLTSQDSASSLTGDGFGYSLFTRYELPKNFFAWLEVEWQLNRSFFGEGSTIPAKWQRAHLLGVGREFRIGFIQMLSMVLYDFNYRSNELHSRPLVFRVGIRFTKRTK